MPVSNSILKSKFIARFGPGHAGFGVKISPTSLEKRIFSDIDGVQRHHASDHVKVITAAYTAVPADSGTTFVFNSTSPLAVTLPLASKYPGFRVRGFTKIASTSGIGHNFVVPAGSKTFGAGITAADAKGVMATQATNAIGDAGEMVSDGTDYNFVALKGTWARIA